MAKYSAELAEKIVNLIEEEFFTVSQVCKATCISRQSFYSWMDTKEEFRKEVELAILRREAELMTMVQASLKRKLEGYYTVVEKDCYEADEITGEAVFKKKTITKKECPPDLRTIKMLLEREDKRKEEERKEQEEAVSRSEETAQINSMEEISEMDDDYPPKKEFIKKEMEQFTSVDAKADRQNRKNRRLPKNIKKHVKFVKF